MKKIIYKSIRSIQITQFCQCGNAGRYRPLKRATLDVPETKKFEKYRYEKYSVQ